MSPHKLTLSGGGAVREVPRVTEIIRAGLPSPALRAWELRGVVDWAMDHYGIVRARGPEAAISGFHRDSRGAAERGSAVHRWIAVILRGEPPPALAMSQRGYTRAFTSWMVDHVDESPGHLVEQRLCDDKISVAGTADYVRDGVLYDWKTVGERPSAEPPLWPNQIAQLGAYAAMKYLVDDDGLVRVLGDPHVRLAPRITRAAIVRLYPDGSYHQIDLGTEALMDAITLWYAVKKVAAATMVKSP